MKKISLIAIPIGIIAVIMGLYTDWFGLANSPQKFLQQGKEAYAKADFSKAIELYQKACDDGNMEGCVELGKMYKVGNGIAWSDARSSQSSRNLQTTL